MFEKDKNKGILMRKRNSQHYSAKQLQSEPLVCAKFAHLLYTFGVFFSKHVLSCLVGYGINFVCDFV